MSIGATESISYALFLINGPENPQLVVDSICGALLGPRAARCQRVLMIANLIEGMESEERHGWQASPAASNTLRRGR